MFSTTALGCWSKKTRRISATTQLRKEDLREDLDTQLAEGFVGLAEQSGHRRKPWSSCHPEMASEPPFPLSSSSPSEGFAFRKCPAITQMTLCFNVVLKTKQKKTPIPHVTPSHISPPLPSPKTTMAIEPGVPSTGEGHHRAGATAR